MVMHQAEHTPLVPPSLFSATDSSKLSGKLASSLTISTSPQAATSKPDLNGSDTTNGIKSREQLRPTFRVLQHLLTDPTISTSVTAIAQMDPHKRFMYILEHCSQRIHELVSEWYDGWLEGVDATGGSLSEKEKEVEGRLEAMVEEVIFVQVLIFGVSGWAWRETGEAMNADFFT